MSVDPWPTAADVVYLACVASVSVRGSGAKNYRAIIQTPKSPFFALCSTETLATQAMANLATVPPCSWLPQPRNLSYI